MISKRIINGLLFTTIGLSLILSGCGKSSADMKPSKVIKISGSSAFAPFIQSRATEYSKINNKEYLIEVDISNSLNALQQLSSGTVDIAMSDVFAYEKISPQSAKTFADNIICVQGYSIITNPDVSISNLSIKQTIDLFTGRMSNWKTFGAQALPIVIFTPDSATGTSTVFRKYALNGIPETEIKITRVASNSAVLAQVSRTSGGVGYVSLSTIYNDSTIKKISLENIEPTSDNIKSGKYPLWSYEHLYTKTQSKDYISTFINYLKSPESKAKLVEMGYIPYDEMTVTR